MSSARHLGDKHDPAGRNWGNSRNGTRTKTVLTEIGPVQIELPRDREGSFEPVIVRDDVCCDGLKGLPESITTVWQRATAQACIAHYANIVVMTLSARGQLWLAVHLSRWLARVTAVLCVPSCRFREIGAHVFRLLGAMHGGHPVASASEVLSQAARLARAMPAED